MAAAAEPPVDPRASGIRVRRADLADPADRYAIVEILEAYASDPAGGGTPLSADVRARLVPALAEVPTSRVFLASVGGAHAGLAVCFVGLSTFRARPLLNVHDLAVLPAHRRTGVGRALLAAVEEHAVRTGCCRITLEVQDGNTAARALYRSFGFTDVVVGTPTRFLAKPLWT